MLWRLRSLMLGLVLGLLFSPGTGAENRRRFWIWLQGKAEEARPVVQAQLQQAATRGASVASQTFDQARQQVTPMAQRAQEKAATIGQSAQQQASQAAQQVSARIGAVAGQAREQVAARMPQGGDQGATPTPPPATDQPPQTSTVVAGPAAPAPAGQAYPVPTTRETPGPGMTAAESNPKNVLREVDRAEAEAESGKD